MGGGGAGVLREILDRFRRSAAVPAAVSTDTGTELAEVFQALDGLDREAAGIRERSQRRIAELDARAAEQVQRELAAGTDAAVRERARAREAGRRSAKAGADAMLDAVDAEVERVRSAGAARIPPLVAEIVDCVLGGAR